MKQFAKLMLLTLGFGLLAAMTGLVGPQPKSTNAAIAAAVNVVNTPGVNANQSGPWNVGITGTPNVSIANTPTVNLAPNTTVGVTGGNFSLTNTPQTPIFTRDKDNAALTPFAANLCFGNADFGNPCPYPSGLVIPGGQRNVIEYVWQSCPESGGWTVGGLQLSTYVGGVSANLALPPGATDPFDRLRIANYQTRIYADPPGITLGALVRPGGGIGVAYCIVTVSGYLVSVP